MRTYKQFKLGNKTLYVIFENGEKVLATTDINKWLPPLPGRNAPLNQYRRAVARLRKQQLWKTSINFE